MIKNIYSKNIVYATTNSTIKDISILMKNNNIGFIPIKENNSFVGVITDRDICILLPVINNIENKVKDYMTKNIISIDINSNIEVALNTMKKFKIKRLLVHDKNKIIGVLSLSDILNYDKNKLIEVIKEIFSIKNNTKEISASIDSFYL